MRIYVPKPSDKVEETAKAREITRALNEYGFSYTGKAGDDWFDISFPKHVNPEAVKQFLENLGARAVSVQPGDSRAIADGIEGKSIEQLISGKLVNTEMIPVEEFADDVQSWRDSLWVEPSNISAAQEQAIYDEVMRQVEPEGFLDQIRQQSRGFLDSGFDNDDPAYQMDEAELRTKADAELRRSR